VDDVTAHVRSCIGDDRGAARMSLETYISKVADNDTSADILTYLHRLEANSAFLHALSRNALVECPDKLASIIAKPSVRP
jgi:hypothetical protein